MPGRNTPISVATVIAVPSAIPTVAGSMPNARGSASGNQVRLDDSGMLMTRTTAKKYASVRHRSEEHTSELQSLMRISYAVFCLKKKTKQKMYTQHNQTDHSERK